MAIYQIGVLGHPPAGAVAALKKTIGDAVKEFGLDVGNDISISIGKDFKPNVKQAAAAVYFGRKRNDSVDLSDFVADSIPVLPVVSSLQRFSFEIPSALRHANGLAIKDDDSRLSKIAATLLQCIGLMPRQRRVFLSYRRTESRSVALQLFEALSARHFDVFLDTHGVPPAEDFQAVLWHRLCDSDVLVMLDTPTYFNSRWTKAEFGRALAKSITVLRLGWPNHKPLPAVAMASPIELTNRDFSKKYTSLRHSAVKHVCAQLEGLRSKSIALRHSKITGDLRAAINSLGGAVEGIGPHRAVYLRLPDGHKIVAYPIVGILTAESLYDAATKNQGKSVAVVYDQIGLHPRWVEHLTWLSTNIKVVRCVRTHEAAWTFADWCS